MTSGRAVFLFDTTHHVLRGEEIALEGGIPVEVVPAPPDRGEARCDLALETFIERASSLESRLTDAGVTFYRHS